MDRSLPARGAPRWVVLAYLALAHVGLGSACVVTLWDPNLIAGFFYHPKMVAVVHALTLGWISSSLIGLLYLAAARLDSPARRLDGWLFAAWAAGSSGLASHFWIEEFNGMTWSAGLLGIAILVIAARLGMAFAVTEVPATIKLQLNLAWLNLLATAFVGLLLGINKTETILPGYSLHNVYAHAHLAALGWVFMTALALGHLALFARTGAPPPAPRWSLHGAVLVQIGAAGVFVSLLLGEPYELGFGITAIAGVIVCCGCLAAHARAAARPLPPGASSVWLLGAIWLAAAAALAPALLRDALGDNEPAWIMAYGVAGLLAGLGQTVLALLFLWLHRLSAGAGRVRPAVFAWSVAAPLLVVGLAATRHTAIRLGSGLLLFAVLWTARSLFRPAAD